MRVTAYKFRDFRLDCGRFELARDGQPIRLERKPLELLLLLLERDGQLVTRQDIAARLWSSEVFVDTEHGINTAIRKVRQALGDDPESPQFILTVTGKGYRFAAPIEVETVPEIAPGPEPAVQSQPRRLIEYSAAAFCLLLVIAGVYLYHARAGRPNVVYTQLTDFTDSAVSPALSPDGRMLAFIRGSLTFLSPDQVYVMTLPAGEPRRLTNDKRPKYGLAFSPDGSQVAYTVIEPTTFSTYTVPVSGGESQLLLSNAAGLVWLDRQQLLFSQIRSGIHLGVVTSTVTRAGMREIYFPSHERGMAHYSLPSPDRKWALVVEMDSTGGWAPCRIISLDGQSEPKSIGPDGPCTSAGWSPDGAWMYFAATIAGGSHLWRQRFPYGTPEQITFGATDEQGIAVEPAGGSLITSVGVRVSSLWIHAPDGDHQLSSEGTVDVRNPPVLRNKDQEIYYLLRREQEKSSLELWRTSIGTGASEAVFPGVPIVGFDVSPDGKEIVYASPEANGTSRLWLAPADKSALPKIVGERGAMWPRFGAQGKILFAQSEGNANFLEEMNSDGTSRKRVMPYPVGDVQSISPGGRWVVALVANQPGGIGPEMMAISVNGGTRRLLCSTFCIPSWSTNGKFLFVPVEQPSQSSAGRSLAMPLGPNENLPELPGGGVQPMSDPSIVKGAVSVPRAALVPGADPEHYAYIDSSVHRNLYRISLQ